MRGFFIIFMLTKLLVPVKAASHIDVTNNCVTFSVGPGTGCAWMCNYCGDKLGTNNYYFTDGVCSYVPGGCVGSPQVGVDYTCCATTMTMPSTTVKVSLDNEKNSPDNNPPGFNLWVGGQYKGDPNGIKVDKTDTNLSYTFDSNVDQLLAWYYNWGWYSGPTLQGPWQTGETITLPEVTSNSVNKCPNPPVPPS